MKIFDLHCDTLTELLSHNLNLENDCLDVSLDGMKGFEKCVRCFAIWAPDILSEQEASEHFDKLYSVFENQLSMYRNEICQVKSNSDFSNEKIGIVITVENGSVLNGSLSKIEKLASLGVKALTLTWNGENSLGYGQLTNRGLKPFGKECVKLLEENNITVDISHLSDAGFEDVCGISKKPFIATHSNCRSLCSHKRNLTDSQLCEIIKRKGLVGLNFYTEFLNNDADKVDKYDILKHAEHILALGGEDSLAIGTDFDGGQMVNGFQNDGEMLNLENLFLQNGFSQAVTDKVLFNNAKRFFEKNIKEVQI